MKRASEEPGFSGRVWWFRAQRDSLKVEGSFQNVHRNRAGEWVNLLGDSERGKGKVCRE